MNISPTQFLDSIENGESERNLNLKEDPSINQVRYRYLLKNCGHTHESATEHLRTDYSNGFTICSKCGSFYHLGKGFTKHLSYGCLHCEGEENHRVYFVKASPKSEGGFPARYMSQMFDDGMSYCKAKLEIGKYANEVEQLKNIHAQHTTV